MKTFGRFFFVIFFVILIPVASLVLFISKSEVESLSKKQVQIQKQIVDNNSEKVRAQIEELIVVFSLFSNSLTPVIAAERHSIEPLILDFKALHYREKGLIGFLLWDNAFKLVGTTDVSKSTLGKVEISPLKVPSLDFDENKQRIIAHDRIMNDEGTVIGYISGVIDVNDLQRGDIFIKKDSPDADASFHCTTRQLSYYQKVYTIRLCGDLSTEGQFSLQKHNLLKIIALLLGTSVGIAFLLAWFGARTLQKPVEQLTNVVAWYQCEDKEKYEQLLQALLRRTDEFGQLANAIHKSRVTIKQLEMERGKLVSEAAL